MQKIYFKKINKKNLDKVLKFLSKGFNWSEERCKSVKFFLLKSNQEIDLFGFVLYNNKKKIVSSILTPYQGIYENNKILSLMSWYSLPIERDLKNIIFAEKFINYLKTKNFSITNYTPSSHVEKILRYFNFKNMIFYRKKTYIFASYLNLKFNFLFNKKKMKLSKINPNKLKEFKNFNLANAVYYSLKDYSKQSCFISIERIVFKKIIGLKLKFKSIHILWCEDSKHIYENWTTLGRLINTSNLPFVFSGDFPIKENMRKKTCNFKHTKYIIFSEDKSLNYFPAIGSELCLSNIY